MERKEKEYDRARSFEQQNVPKASLPSPSFLTILHGGEERKHFKDREGGGEGGGGRRREREICGGSVMVQLRAATLCQIITRPTTQLFLSRNYKLVH